MERGDMRQKRVTSRLLVLGSLGRRARLFMGQVHTVRLMEDTSSRWKLGAITAICLAAFIFAVFFVSIKRKALESTIILSGVFRDASGVQPGNSVRLGGVEIGEVDQIEFEDDSSVRVYVLIEEEYQQFIRLDAKMAIGSDGLLGDKVINIIKGSADSGRVQNGTQLSTLKAFDPSKLLSSFQRTAANFSMMSKEFSKVNHQLNSTHGAIGRFLNDPSFSAHVNHVSDNLNRLNSDTSSSPSKEPKKKGFFKRVFGKEKRSEGSE